MWGDTHWWTLELHHPSLETTVPLACTLAVKHALNICFNVGFLAIGCWREVFLKDNCWVTASNGNGEWGLIGLHKIAP